MIVNDSDDADDDDYKGDKMASERRCTCVNNIAANGGQLE